MESDSEIVERLTNEIQVLNAQATRAMKDRNFKLEDEIQLIIDEKVKEKDFILTKSLIKKYDGIDFDEEIKKAYATHDWRTSERCNGCAMKEHTTFKWKAEGVRANLEEFPGESIKILESMICRKLYK